MPVNDELGKRLKSYYEEIPKTKLMRRTPVAIRIDGKAFHTFTRSFEKPFDKVLIKAMQETMKYLCENIQGCVLGYTQSDEITLILVDYKKLNSSAWFDYEVQKMCSIAASMATMAFNKAFDKEVTKFYLQYAEEDKPAHEAFKDMNKLHQYVIYDNACSNGAMFDARVFNIPKEEVTNLLYWRQVDAARNSIQMAARAYFSHNECNNKNQSQLQEMLFQEKGINWNDYPTHLKRGSCCIKEYYQSPEIDGACVRSRWVIDTEIPMFKSEGRNYVEKLIQPEEE
jgi:tRNA(His) 5'-end guanylyltransferase